MLDFDTCASTYEKSLIEKYGETPRRPLHLTVTVLEERAFALSDTFPERLLDFHLEYPKSSAHIPAYSLLPENPSAPIVVAIGTYERLSDSPIPTRELLSRGLGILYIPCESVSSIRGALRQSADKAVLPSRRGNYTAGKVSLYAYALALAREYLSRLGFTRLVSFGHGATAEAALLAVARDEGFSLAIADSPFLTERSSPFLPDDFYSIAYLGQSHPESVNLFEGIYPRGIILGLSDSSVPDERDLILDMLKGTYNADKGDCEALISGKLNRISGHGYRIFGLSGTPILTPETALAYLDAITELFENSCEPITV